MPLPMVHLGVAHALAEKRSISDLATYYVGVLAPDAYHRRTAKTGKDRMDSHLYQAEFPPYEVWVRDIRAFFANVRPGNDFTLGYQVHLLTDACWFSTEYEKFRQNYTCSHSAGEGERQAYYNDTCRLDIELYDNLPSRGALWDHLAQAKGETLPGLVTAAESEAERDYTLTWYELSRNRYPAEPKYLSLQDVLSFIRGAADAVDSLLTRR